MNGTDTEKKDSPVDKIRGYHEVEGHNKKGEPVTIKVREIPFIELDKFLDCFGSFSREMALYTGLSAKELGELDDATLKELGRVGRLLNGETYEKALEWHDPLLKRAMPNLAAQMAQVPGVAR